MKVLERLATEKTKFVKRTKDGTQKRNYTYLDRAKKSVPGSYIPTQQKEEAIAEMFRDYICWPSENWRWRTAFSFFEKIKKFFKALIGTNVDEWLQQRRGYLPRYSPW
jgi:hypothetical protein